MHKALSNMLQRLLSRFLPAIGLRIYRHLAFLSISVSLEISIDDELLAACGGANIGHVLGVVVVASNVVSEVGFLVFLGVAGGLALVVLVVLILSRVSVGHVMLDGKEKEKIARTPLNFGYQGRVTPKRR